MWLILFGFWFFCIRLLGLCPSKKNNTHVAGLKTWEVGRTQDFLSLSIVSASTDIIITTAATDKRFVIINYMLMGYWPSFFRQDSWTVYPAIWTEQAWSIRIYHMEKEHCLFLSRIHQSQAGKIPPSCCSGSQSHSAWFGSSCLRLVLECFCQGRIQFIINKVFFLFAA